MLTKLFDDVYYNMMNKFHSSPNQVNNQNKYGTHLRKHNIDTQMKHKKHDDLLHTHKHHHNKEEEITIVTTQPENNSVMPKLRAVVEMALSRAKLQNIIGQKKW
jgi:hypothetical protein